MFIFLVDIRMNKSAIKRSLAVTLDTLKQDPDESWLIHPGAKYMESRSKKQYQVPVEACTSDQSTILYYYNTG